MKPELFPKLYRDREMTVVWFFSEHSGMVVAAYGKEPLHQIKDNQVSCFDTKFWTPLPKGQYVAINQDK